jgi:hypothetical protein
LGRPAHLTESPARRRRRSTLPRTTKTLLQTIDDNAVKNPVLERGTASALNSIDGVKLIPSRDAV